LFFIVVSLFFFHLKQLPKLNSNNGHMIKFEFFDSDNAYQCHFAELGTFVVSIAHYMRAYFNYQAVANGLDFALPEDAGYLNVSTSVSVHTVLETNIYIAMRIDSTLAVLPILTPPAFVSVRYYYVLVFLFIIMLYSASPCKTTQTVAAAMDSMAKLDVGNEKHIHLPNSSCICTRTRNVRRHMTMDKIPTNIPRDTLLMDTPFPHMLAFDHPFTLVKTVPRR
jgi:hypothetical protein